VLGVPLLFGILRKELSLLMVFQALGGFEVDAYLSDAQIFTFVVFVTLYVPCVSTFAVMLKTLGGRRALMSVGLSVGIALAASGAVRLALQLGQLLAA
jgi:ferrous iron transport protein B